MIHKVFLIKPSRTSDAMPELSIERPLAMLSKGIQTCLVLDLNILNHFKNYQQTPMQARSPQLVGDIAAIKKILGTPALFIAAGFAIGEADESYVEVLSQAYEDFLTAELPGYRDAHNAIPIGRERTRSRQFKSLPEQDQLFFASAHLALLKVHDILFFHQTESPEAKLDMYLEYMDGVADLVPGIESEIAKHCFFRSPADAHDPFLSQSALIRANFNKGGRGDKRVDRILNGARDIMLLRATAMKDGKPLDGKTQDTWLLTTDSGLAALCNSIYFYPVEGERAKFTTTVDSPFRERNGYWRYADKASSLLFAERRSESHRRPQVDTATQLQQLRALAQELNERLARLTANT